jgi:hypothetical protein
MFVKAPADVLDYEWDWSQWLPTGDTISGITFTATTGITIASSPAPSHTTTTATVWLQSGTAGNVYAVTCQIVTTGGRTASWSQNVNVVNL